MGPSLSTVPTVAHMECCLGSLKVNVEVLRKKINFVCILNFVLGQILYSLVYVIFSLQFPISDTLI